MKTVKKGAFDEYKFAQHWKYDTDFQKFFPGGSKFDQGFEGDCSDVFATLFRKKWKYAEGDEDPHLKRFIESMKETEEYKNLRRVTVKKAGASFEGMKKLMEAYDRSGKEEDAQKRRIAAREAAQEATKAAEDYTRVADTCGLGCGDQEFGEDGEAAEADKIRAIQKLMKNDFTKQIIDMAGRAQSVANHAIETKCDRGDTKLVGVETGGNLTKILPSELCFAATCPELFIYRMLEGQLMQYKSEGEKPMGYGPIIVCIDESGSMYGPKNLFAKALLFGMWVVANNQKRSFYVIRFSTAIKTHKIEKLRDITALLDMFMNGGTNFEDPLLETVKIISDAQGTNPEMKTADMIFLTDGIGHVSRKVLDQIMEKKQQLRFKILSAMITSAGDMRSSDVALAKKILETFSDTVFSINDIYKDNEFLKSSLSIGGD
jgi:uncharacterized protein with von Willebrand factor type A (vWA) domain